MPRRASDLIEYLRASLWLPPLLGVLLALAGSVTTVYIDLTFGDTTFVGWTTDDPEAARSILSVVASSMLTLTALVFTITIVVLQLAASQYSPRITRTFLRDRQTKLTLAIFLSTFAYALLVLRSVSSIDGNFVPSLSLLATYLLVFCSILAFIGYLNHIAQAIQVSHILRRIAREAGSVLDRLDREPPPQLGDVFDGSNPSATVVWRGEAGVLSYVDERALARLGARADCVLRVRPAVGDFIPSGAPILDVFGTPEVNVGGVASNLLTVAVDRTPQQDLLLAIRHIVDLALRALSTGINDPTTAVQSIDQLHDLLRRMVTRPLQSPYVFDDEGRLRVVIQRLSWETCLAAAVTELRHSGTSSVQTSRRLLYLLDDLLSIAPPDRRASILEQRHLLLEAVEQAFPVEEDRLAACCGDPQGLGSRVQTSTVPH